MNILKSKLEKDLRSIIKDATDFKLGQEIENRTKSLQKESHFGGYPYFEKGDKWPTTKDGTPLDFIFQIFNNQNLNLPSEIKLIQFFVNTTKPPWEHEEEGWEVRIYKELNFDNKLFIEYPAGVNEFECAKIIFEEAKSLPTDEDIDFYLNEESLDIISLLREKEDFSFYDLKKEILNEKRVNNHQLGGYPSWLQYAATPTKNSRLLFQIDHSWTSYYVFYNEQTKQIEYVFQAA